MSGKGAAVLNGTGHGVEIPRAVVSGDVPSVGLGDGAARDEIFQAGPDAIAALHRDAAHRSRTSGDAAAVATVDEIKRALSTNNSPAQSTAITQEPAKSGSWMSSISDFFSNLITPTNIASAGAATAGFFVGRWLGDGSTTAGIASGLAVGLATKLGLEYLFDEDEITESACRTVNAVPAGVAGVVTGGIAAGITALIDPAWAIPVGTAVGAATFAVTSIPGFVAGKVGKWFTDLFA